MIPPGTPIEKAIAGIWAEVLSLDEVGVNDKFLDIGGHSLAASSIISQVSRAFHIELPIRELFDSPTVAEMALVISSNQQRQASQGNLERMLDEVEAISDEEAQRRVDGINSTIANK
jgi:acyl carrier protein